MLHLDGGPHCWLELAGADRQTLIQVIDDATNRLLYAHQANAYLREQYLRGHNEFRARCPQDPQTAFVPAREVDLDDILCIEAAQRVYKNALRAMRRALQKAGLPAHYTLHSLRHTFGSGLISLGVSPDYV